jgi:hypothetical protein
MEGFTSPFKNENRSLFLDAFTLEALQAVVEDHMHYYNLRRRHSTIGYRVPFVHLKRLKSEPEQSLRSH